MALFNIRASLQGFHTHIQASIPTPLPSIAHLGVALVDVGDARDDDSAARAVAKVDALAGLAAADGKEHGARAAGRVQLGLVVLDGQPELRRVARLHDRVLVPADAVPDGGGAARRGRPPALHAALQQRVGGEEDQQAVGDEARVVDHGVAQVLAILPRVAGLEGGVERVARGAHGHHAHPDLGGRDHVRVLQPVREAHAQLGRERAQRRQRARRQQNAPDLVGEYIYIYRERGGLSNAEWPLIRRDQGSLEPPNPHFLS